MNLDLHDIDDMNYDSEVDFIGFEETYSKGDPNKGVFTEVAEKAGFFKEELRTIGFEKTAEGTITITGFGYSEYCHFHSFEQTIEIPETIAGLPVTAIAPYASFNNTSGNDFVQDVTLPKTLKIIGKAAFADSEISSIVIPASVTEIGEYAIGYIPDWATGKGVVVKPGDEKGFDKDDEFVISCYPGTAGEKYAKDNGFEYKLLSE